MSTNFSHLLTIIPNTHSERSLQVLLNQQGYIPALQIDCYPQKKKKKVPIAHPYLLAGMYRYHILLA